MVFLYLNKILIKTKKYSIFKIKKYVKLIWIEYEKYKVKVKIF